MGKKGGNSKGKGSAEGEVGADPAIFLKNYTVLCKSFGIRPHEDVVDAANADDKPLQIAAEGEMEPVGVRALMEALAGDKESLGGPYNLINTIRLWRVGAGDEGTRSVADYLRKTDCVQFLQMLDCKISLDGCRYLGDALQTGVSKSLLTLNLDHNTLIGAEGFRALTEGLCTNRTLKRLSMAYCNIGPAGGRSVKNLLMGIGTQLEQLNLQGNKLQGPGLQMFAKALGKNSVLLSLNLSDNDIGPDCDALFALASALKVNTTLLELQFDRNHIDEEGGQVFLNAGLDKKDVNSTLREFTLDVNMPSDMFNSLIRAGGGGKGKKGKGGKKKKK